MRALMQGGVTNGWALVMSHWVPVACTRNRAVFLPEAAWGGERGHKKMRPSVVSVCCRQTERLRGEYGADFYLSRRMPFLVKLKGATYLSTA